MMLEQIDMAAFKSLEGELRKAACFDRRVERPSIRLLRADVCGGGGKFRS